MATDFRKFCNCGLHGNFYTLEKIEDAIILAIEAEYQFNSSSIKLTPYEYTDAKKYLQVCPLSTFLIQRLKFTAYNVIPKAIYNIKDNKCHDPDETEWVRDGLFWYPPDLIAEDEFILEKDLRLSRILNEALPLSLKNQCDYLKIEMEYIPSDGSKTEDCAINYLRQKGFSAYFLENSWYSIIENLLQGYNLSSLIFENRIRTTYALTQTPLKNMLGSTPFKYRVPEELCDDDFWNQLIKTKTQSEWRTICKILSEPSCDEARLNSKHLIPINLKNDKSRTGVWLDNHKGWPDILAFKDGKFYFYEVKAKDKLHESQINTYISYINEKYVKIPWRVIQVK